MNYPGVESGGVPTRTDRTQIVRRVYLQGV